MDYQGSFSAKEARKHPKKDITYIDDISKDEEFDITDGLTAVEMNDRISSILYCSKDGKEYYSNTDSYSIADYAYSQLSKANSTDALKTLCANLLRYGAKAQLYKEYRTDALADERMTEEARAYLSDLETVTFGKGILCKLKTNINISLNGYFLCYANRL